MRTDQSKDFQIKEKQGHQGVLFSEDRGMQSGPVFHQISVPSVGALLRKFLSGIQKIWIALKFWFFRLTGVVPREIKLPWFKIGLVALALFILTKKDIQFSLNMSAPLQGMIDDGESSNKKEEMSLAHPINLITERTSNANSASAEELEEAQVKSYLKRFTKVAVTEQEKFGMPASVKLAQAVIESWAGQRPADLQDNNHFGQPLQSEAYGNAWENWRAHSLLIRQQFPELFKYGSGYKKWAKGLKKMGYSQERNYDKKLIEIIEKYQLYLLDE